VADDEIKFGYAVTGVVHPARVKANAGARPGDALVFTSAWHRSDFDGPQARHRESRGCRDVDCIHAHAEPPRLRRDAALRRTRCTDVTGFGLIGHAREMALASQ